MLIINSDLDVLKGKGLHFILRFLFYFYVNLVLSYEQNRAEGSAKDTRHPGLYNSARGPCYLDII